MNKFFGSIFCFLGIIISFSSCSLETHNMNSYSIDEENSSESQYVSSIRNNNDDYSETYSQLVDTSSEIHQHLFVNRITNEKYKYSDASCEKKAEYFYSCVCGEKGNSIFETGESLGHDFTKQDPTADNLSVEANHFHPASYFYVCSRCNKKGTQTYEYGTSVEHIFNQQILSDKYIVSRATCTTGSIYRKSCVCGEPGLETFEANDSLGHSFTSKNVDSKYLKTAQDCQHCATYYYSCCRCGEKGTTTFESGEPSAHLVSEWEYNANYFEFDSYYRKGICGECGKNVNEYFSSENNFVQYYNRYDLTYGLGYKTFYNDERDNYISVPETFNGNIIREVVFSDCVKVKSLHLSKNISSINPDFFWMLNNLENIDIDKENSVYYSQNNCVIETKTKQLVKGCNKSIIPNDGTVTSIGYYAFAGNHYIESLIIPGSIENVRGQAFKSCFVLKNVVFESGLKSLEHHVFNFCYSLESIYIPKSIVSIGRNIFWDSNNIPKIYYEGTEEEWNSINIDEDNDDLKNAVIQFNCINN